MSVAAPSASPALVYSTLNPNRVYLKISSSGRAVRVSPTALGRRTLNRFWPWWLRDLAIKKLSGKFGTAVEIQGQHVVVYSDQDPVRLMATIGQLAGQVRPLPRPYLRRMQPYRESSYKIGWFITDKTFGGLLPSAGINAIALPRGARLQAEWDELFLTRQRTCPLRLADIGQITELQVALISAGQPRP